MSRQSARIGARMTATATDNLPASTPLQAVQLSCDALVGDMMWSSCMLYVVINSQLLYAAGTSNTL